MAGWCPTNDEGEEGAQPATQLPKASRRTPARCARAGDDLEAKALQRALLASVGVKFHGEAVDEEDWAE